MTMENGEHIPDVVRAKRFELVDDDGNPRAALGFVSHDESEEMPFMALLDKEGSAKMILWLAEDGTSNIKLMGKEDSAISLRLDKDGNSGLSFQREGNVPNLLMNLNENGPDLTLYGKDSSDILSVSIGDNGTALALYGKGKTVLAVRLDKDNNPNIGVFNLGENTYKSLI